MRNILGSIYQQNKPEVPIVAFYRTKHDYQQPSLNEGFNEILQVPFNIHFNNQQERELFDSVRIKD